MRILAAKLVLERSQLNSAVTFRLHSVRLQPVPFDGGDALRRIRQ
jgi:hypothetical protein